MARFSSQLLDDIRNRLSLSDLIGRRVSYDRRKSQPQKGDFWGCCPFHSEKTPSFHVDDRKGIYHCFGCGVTGDHFRFLVEKEGLSFPEAVEQLADEAGIALPKPDQHLVAAEKSRASLYEVMVLAQQFFLEQLQEKEGAAARGYLNERGVRLETQRHFGIGFAPRGRAGLKQYLAAQGVAHEQMVEAGLVVAGADIAVSYDKFRDRIMFPILDLRGRVIAFGGRAMSRDNPAKYMNSPETALFSKRSVLYNAANARKAAHERGRLIVVEGYMDVIALAQAGFHEAVAPLGTALSEEQLRLLWKITDEPILCFDGDEAGLRAANRSVDVALPLLAAGKSVGFCLLPGGQDPDDLLRHEGSEVFRELLSRSRSLSEMIWTREIENGTFDTPERRAGLEMKFNELIRLIGDPNVRRYYEQAFRDRLRRFFYQMAAGTGAGAPYSASARGQNQAKHGKAGNGWGKIGGPALISEKLRQNPLTARNYEPGPTSLVSRELVLLMTLVNHPSLLGDYIEELAALSFRHDVLRRLQSALIDCCPSGDDLSAPDLRAQLAARGLAKDIEQLEAALAGLPLWQVGADAADSAAEMIWKQALALHHRAHTLNKELKAAENAYVDDESELNLERLLDVNAQIASLERADILSHSGGDEQSAASL